MGECGRNTAKQSLRVPLLTFAFLALFKFSYGVEHNLPDNVELVDPKDLGLDSQFDLDKLLGNVKALPIDTNALSSALGKPGLKTQVLTVGFDGSEGLNLDDFELPQLKNDEHGPLAQEAFKSFKNFFKNTSMATPIEKGNPQVPVPTTVQFSKPVQTQTPRPGGKRRTTMKRRKVLRVNGTTTTPPPPQSEPQASPSGSGGPKVIELDSSQIEKLIASGKIGPPKSLTPGGPQVIELGQSDLDALLNSENGDEIKQILEGGDTIQNFDLSQLSGASAASPKTQEYQTSTRISEDYNPPGSQSQIVTSPLPTASSTTFQTTTASLNPSTPEAELSGTTPPQVPQVSTTTLAPSSSENTQPPAPPTTGLPIIYQYNSAQDVQSKNAIPPQGIQGAIPLQFYSSHANGHQQARLVKTPTFEFISAPPVSFSSSVLSTPNVNSNQNQVLPVQSSNVQQQPQFQLQPQTLFIQPQAQFQHQFITLPQNQPNFQQSAQQFIPGPPPPVQQQSQHDQSPPSTPKPLKKDTSLNKIIPAAQTSHHTEEVKFKSPSSNYISSLHKVNLPLNSVKLVTPSPQIVHTVLNQVPESFQPSIAPNHVVSSPVLDPLRVGNPSNAQNTFLRASTQQQQPINSAPFRNTHLFSNPLASSGQRSQSSPIRTHPSAFVRFPSASTSSAILNSSPNRFRVAESQNPFFTFRPAGAGGFGNLILNSFVAGDGLNYRARSREDFQAPGL